MIVVIGANSRLGLQCAAALRGEDRLVGLSRAPNDETRAAYDEVHSIDYRHPAAAAAVLERIAEGHITVVNFAARKIDKLLVDVEPDEVDEVFDINLKLNFLLLPPLVRRMVTTKWGRIIFIASSGAAMGGAGISLYATAKAGLTGLARSLAKEYGRFGVTTNVLSLGYFDAGLYLELPERIRASLRAQVPSGQLGSGADIANGVRFLIRSQYVNGAVIPIDGGI